MTESAVSTDRSGVPGVTPGAKMLYLIKRKSTTTRDELVAHWFANHMPGVIQRQKKAAKAGKPHARKYIASLFEASKGNEYPWDGIAQLWLDEPLPMPDVPLGSTPTDTFQQKAAPYLPWATREYVVMDSSERLAAEPLTLNDPFPCTRSGFYKKSFLVPAKPDTDYDLFFQHWLDVHIPNVKSVMEQVGGFHYIVNHSINPSMEPYAGMAELYFENRDGWEQYKKRITADGMEKWVDSGMLVLGTTTEMIGLP